MELNFELLLTTTGPDLGKWGRLVVGVSRSEMSSVPPRDWGVLLDVEALVEFEKTSGFISTEALIVLTPSAMIPIARRVDVARSL